MEIEQQRADGSDDLPNQDALRATSWVLWLVGSMLLAKLTADVADAIIVDWALYIDRPWLPLLPTLPTLALLGLIGLLLLRRGSVPSSRAMKSTLMIIMVIATIQIIARPVILYIGMPSPDMSLLSAFLSGSLGGFTRSRAHLQTGVVFMMIPAVLGAWISGWHHAWRWATFGALLSACAILVLNHRDMAIPELIPFIAEDVALVLLTLFVGRLADQERAKQSRLQQANRLLAEQGRVREQLAASRERLHMARELHDTVAHSLAGLVFQLDALGTLIGDAPESAQQTLALAKAVARQGLVDARLAVTDLRMGTVEDQGLFNALQQHIKTVAAQCDIPITFEPINCAPARLDDLDKAVSDALFRIVQEAIYNASQHARAQQITVKLVQAYVSAQAQLMISVEDDGVGFDNTALQAGHYGVRGMRERAELVGAQLQMESSAGKGTIISVVLPLKS